MFERNWRSILVIGAWVLMTESALYTGWGALEYALGPVER